MSALTATAALSVTEERDLVRRAQAGDKAATAALITCQLRYLRSEAHKYARSSGVDIDDLVSAAIEALLESLAGFDAARGVRLFTFAQTHIREAMADEVAAYSSSIAIPGRTLRRYRRAIRETTSLADARHLAHSRDAMDPATFNAVHAALTGGQSLDRPLTSGAALSSSGDTGAAGRQWDSEISAENALMGSRGPAPEGTAISRHLTAQALAALDDRQRAVIALTYLGAEPMSDAQAAERLGLSKTMVVRARVAGLAAMRAVLA